MLQQLYNRLTANRLTVFILVLFCAVGYQKYTLGGENNFLIFAKPFHNLLQQKIIYGFHPTLYFDTYKYSPTFAWLMGPFYYMPVWLGVVLWNLLNTVVLLLGLREWFMNGPDGDRRFRIAVLIVVAEALITAQNVQSNNFIIGAILLAIKALEREKPVRAAFLFVLVSFIKFYGGAAAICFLFYPKKIRFLLAMGVWTLLFAAAPLTMLPFDNLVLQYKTWFEVMHDSKLGQLVSLLGIAEYWFGMAKTDTNLHILEAIGATLFLLPLLRFKLWSDAVYQQRMVAFFLLFVILFNKMAESPTYVLAVVGVAIWWMTLEAPTRYDRILLSLVIIFTSLSPTDIFPKFIRNNYFVPMNVKAMPCVLVWLRVMLQLWTQEAVKKSEKAEVMEFV